MDFLKIRNLGCEAVRRLTGVKKKTFNTMLEILTSAEKEQKKLGGKPNKLKMQDRLMMTLEYLREYRTYFHIGQRYGVSESTAYNNIRWIENILIKNGRFSLHGKKELLKIILKLN